MPYFGYSRYPAKVRTRSIIRLASSAFRPPRGTVLPRPRDGPPPGAHPLGLFGLPPPVRQGPQALQQLLFLLPGLLPPLLEAPLARARLEVLDVAEDHGHEHGGAFAPTRPRDVDFADAAHAVLLEVGPDGVSRFPPA